MASEVSVILESSLREDSGLTVEILPRGLTIHRLIARANGHVNDIVIGPEKPEDHVTQKYTNTIIGRFTNRIPVRKYVLERKGIKSEFAPQANENSKVSLHGGTAGYDVSIWEVLQKGAIPQLFSETELERVHSFPEKSYSLFRLVSPDGDQGYPGELLTEVLVLLASTPDQRIKAKLGSLIIIYRAKLNGREKKVTPINLTQHWGFNLDASLSDARQPDVATIKDHVLNIQAKEKAKLGELYLPVGGFTSVSSLPAYDFQRARPIGQQYPDPGYNDYYHFVDSTIYPLPTRILLSDLHSFNMLDDIISQENLNTPPCVQLSSKKASMVLEFFSNQHGVMFYSHYLANPTHGARKLIHGGSGINECGASYGPWTAAFLEFHDSLAAFLWPENKDKEDTLLTSDEMYNNVIKLEVSTSG